MAVCPLSLEPDPVLRGPIGKVSAFGPPVKRLVRNMLDTMYANDGIGIAAPQIGQPVQVFIANPSRRRGEELVAINPHLTLGRSRVSGTEGCLSLPDIWGKVRRASQVRMKAHDLSGKRYEVEAGGLMAVILQHEFDHLQGTLFIDRLSWIEKHRLRRALRLLACE